LAGVGVSVWIAVTVFVVAYVLIATERVHKTVAALAGAGVLLALGVVGSEQAFYSHETGVDWDVVFLLLGMMIIVGCCGGPGCSSTRRSGRRSGPRARRCG
jgi:Na+/H+ antiporter NhaD/arsenite permease-like protein